MYRLSRKQISEQSKMNYTTRLQSTFPIPQIIPRSNKFLKCLSYQGLKMWAEFCPEMRLLESGKFNLKLKELINSEMDTLLSI